MLMTLLFHSEIIVSVTDATVYRFLHLLQNNLVGIPLVHEVNVHIYNIYDIILIHLFFLLYFYLENGMEF